MDVAQPGPVTDGSDAKPTRAPHKKSRYGCASCKKLRIKCDETKPSCEYCLATNRACVYLEPLPLKPRQRRRTSPQFSQHDQQLQSQQHQSQNLQNHHNHQLNLPSNHHGAPFIIPAEDSSQFVFASAVPPKMDLFPTFYSATTTLAPESAANMAHASLSSSTYSDDSEETSPEEFVSEPPPAMGPEASSSAVTAGPSSAAVATAFGPVSSSTSPVSNSVLAKSSSDFGNPNATFNPLGKRSASELHCLDFFLRRAVIVCSLGEPTVARMWKTEGVRVALERDGVMSGIMAFSTYLMHRFKSSEDTISVVAMNHYLRTVNLLRQRLAEDKSKHCPAELIFTSFLVVAFAFSDTQCTPVLARSGQLDFYTLLQGLETVITAYDPKRAYTESMFTAHDAARSYPELANSRSKYNERPMEFILFLEEKLAGFTACNVIDQVEAQIYQAAIDAISFQCHLSLHLGNFYSLFSGLRRIPDQFVNYCREGRQFALVIQSFQCALFRKTLFHSRYLYDTWDRCLDECLAGIHEPAMAEIAEQARLMRRGVVFTDDVSRILALSPFAALRYGRTD